MPISAVDSISLAVEHTKRQLFQPFRLGQWVKLGFVGLLAGELGSGGGIRGSNFHLPTEGGGSPDIFRHGLAGVDVAALGMVLGVLVIAGLVLALFLMYVGGVMRFVLFDSILARECRIRRGWNARQSEGWKYFLWKLLYLFIAIGGAVILIGIPAGFAFAAGWLNQPKEHLVPLVLGGLFVVFLFLLFFLLLSVVFVLTKDFVVPQMALENIGVLEGWRRLWPMLNAEMGGFSAYIGMKIVLAIAAGILVLMATLILGLLFAVPTVGLGILAVLTGQSAGLVWNAYTITLAVVVGAILLAIFLFLVALISVPVIVFFPAYSIYFFAGRYPALSAALYPAAIAVQIPAAYSPPYEPPALPPNAAPVG